MYNTEYSPVEYLERRMRYYVKGIAKTKGLINKEWFIKKYGKVALKKQIKLSVEYKRKRIKEFNIAIEILKKSKTYNDNKLHNETSST